MKQTLNSFLLKFMSMACFVLISYQNGYAQTAAEFLKKNDQEQQKIAVEKAAFMINKISELLSTKTLNEKTLSEEELIRFRRYNNIAHAIFIKTEDKKIEDVVIEFTISKLNFLADQANKKNPKADFYKDAFLEYISIINKVYYINSNAEWKKKFDSKTDAERASQIKKAFYRDILEIQLETLKERANAIKEKMAANEAEIEANKAWIKEHDRLHKAAIKEINKVVTGVVQSLEVSFRPLNKTPKVGFMVFRNRNSPDTVPAEFTLQCFNNKIKSKDLLISVTASEEKIVALTNGKNAMFVVGEQCDFYVGGEKIRSYTVASE